MTNQQLVNYIQTQVQNGYPIEQIQSYLIQQGYKEKDVKSAVNSLRGGTSSKKKIIQYLIIATMALAIGYMMYYNYSKTGSVFG